MEVRLDRNGFSCYHNILRTVIPKEVSQESVVSDTLPDIASIITTEGVVLIRSKDVGEGRIRLEANIPVKICYLPEDGDGIRRLDVNLPLYVSTENEAISPDSKCTVRLVLKSLTAKLLNPRKVSANALVEVHLNCYQAGETFYQTLPESEAGAIHVLERETEQNAVCCVTEKTFVLTDALNLPQENAPAEELIGEHISISVEDLKPIGTKLIMKGTVHSVLLYESDAHICNAAEFSTPFSQIIDAECETENAIPVADVLASGLYYEIARDSDGRTVNMELHAVAQLTLWGSGSARYIADVYSNTFDLVLQKERRETMQFIREAALRDTVRFRLDVGEPVQEVLSVNADILGAEASENTARLILHAVVFCCQPDGTVQTVQRTLAAELPMQISGQERFMITNVNVGDISSASSENGLELRVAVELHGQIYLKNELECVAGIEYDENAPVDTGSKPSLVLMNVSSGEDLWLIAKDNCSTVAAILEANGLEDGDTWDQLLLIPRIS